MKHSATLLLTNYQKRDLEKVLDKPSVSPSTEKRARAILLCATGKSDKAVAENLLVSIKSIKRWKIAFEKDGLDFLAKTRISRNKIPADLIKEILKRSRKPPPSPAKRWTAALMAREFGISSSSITRIWKEHGVNPIQHITESAIKGLRKADSREEPYTLKDIAEILGISHTTVSMALHNSPKVSRETRRSVKTAAKLLNYQPNFFATQLKKKSNKEQLSTIACFVTLSSWSQVRHLEHIIINPLKELLVDYGYCIEVFELRFQFPDHQKLGKQLSIRGISNIILIDTNESDVNMDLTEFDSIIINVQEQFDQSTVTQFGFDWFSVTKLAVEKAVGLGYKRIGVFHNLTTDGKETTNSFAFERITGAYQVHFTNQTERKPLPVLRPDNFTVHGPQDSEEVLFKEWMKLYKPDILLVSGQTHKLFKYIQDLELRIPRDVGIVQIGKIFDSRQNSLPTNNYRREYAFDGDKNTCFKGFFPNNQWVGLKLDQPYFIRSIRFLPSSTSETKSDMKGGLFQGAQNADFSDAVELAKICFTPRDDQFNKIVTSIDKACTYIRYLGPEYSYGCVSQLEFYGSRSASNQNDTIKLKGRIIGSKKTNSLTISKVGIERELLLRNIIEYLLGKRSRLHESSDIRIRPQWKEGEFTTVIVSKKKSNPQDTPPSPQRKGSTHTDKSQFTLLNLKPHLNQSSSIPSQWIGYPYALSKLPSGVKTINTIDFRIVDSNEHFGYNYIRIRPNTSTKGHTFTSTIQASVTINISQFARKIHFLHACAFGHEHKAFAHYILTYADGSTAKKSLIPFGPTLSHDVKDDKRYDIATIQDWWPCYPRFRNEQCAPYPVNRESSPAQIRFLYTLAWEHPHPSKKIESLTIESNRNRKIAFGLFAITLETPKRSETLESY